jgi:putative FmdB family regulatory protein
MIGGKSLENEDLYVTSVSHVERRMTMPLYEFFCDKCRKEVSMTLSISEREKGDATCPECGGRELHPLVGTFFAKTSRKS